MGGRSFLRRIIDLSCADCRPHHYIKITAEARDDIEWWRLGLSIFHGSSVFPVDVQIPSHAFSCDASSVGGSSNYAGDWLYVNWLIDYPDLADKHITFLELFCILLAAKRWGHLWHGLHLRVRTDNMAALAGINNTTSRSN